MTYSSAEHVKHLEKALLRAAKKMVAMAHCLEKLGDKWDDPAIRLLAGAAFAYEALHKEFD